MVPSSGSSNETKPPSLLKMRLGVSGRIDALKDKLANEEAYLRTVPPTAANGLSRRGR